MCFFFVILDFDECFVEISLCDKNVDCSNGDGFYSCMCK